ncbi:MAG TPA: hypothetical protein VMF03_02415 [Steroidobacteraceae bacterium]|nr:hypothetical protein [Steroidobacteraceae bacterium]
MSARAVTRRSAAFASLAALALLAQAASADDPTTDPTDRQTLERSLFLCRWKTTHDVPDNAPNPAVCRSDTVSTDVAMLQLKQWWTFWARLNPDAALRANQQFSTDYAAFQERLKLKPEIAQQLLPPGLKLQKDDWRLRLVRELSRR